MTFLTGVWNILHGAPAPCHAPLAKAAQDAVEAAHEVEGAAGERTDRIIPLIEITAAAGRLAAGVLGLEYIRHLPPPVCQ